MVANCFLGVCVCLLLLLITVQRRSSKHNKPGFAIGKPIARGKDRVDCARGGGNLLLRSSLNLFFFFPSHILSDLGKRRDADYCQCLELRSATFLFLSLSLSRPCGASREGDIREILLEGIVFALERVSGPWSQNAFSLQKRMAHTGKGDGDRN